MSAPTSQQCQTIQILEPDSDVPVDSAAGSSDPSLSERGDLILTQGQDSAQITFLTTKAGANYRFEYLYVDAIGVSSPGVFSVVPVNQTPYGFTVLFTGSPIADGYVLRWRVVVVAVTQLQLDTPESLYVPLPQARVANIAFVNPRSDTLYGFTELRVENLTDQNVVVINIMVRNKTTTGFTIEINPTPPTGNYYLAVRTP